MTGTEPNTWRYFEATDAQYI